MSAQLFEHSPDLDALGVEHGFGLRGSDAAPPAGLVTARQVHGTRLARIPTDERGLEADALFTTAPGVAVGVRTADCVPILLVDSQRRGVAAVHAGWRGSAARIAELAVLGMAEALAVGPENIWAVVGPHIGACCYEVDEPVRAAIGDSGALVAAARSGHYMLDLYELNREQLVRAGVAHAKVVRVGSCTSCHADRYPSYRRDGTGGRVLHYVRMYSA